MDQSLSESDAPSQSLSAVVVALMKGVLYQEQDTGLWQALLRLQVRVRDYVAVLGLELTLDESEGYAFLRSRAVADGEPELPRLVARRQLSFPVIHHFDDLNRAHEAVLKAKAQVERLTPLTADCERHAELIAEVEASRACRDALKTWFAQRKSKLLDKRLAHLAEEQTRLTARIGALSETKRGQQADERELRRAISESGGDRIDAEDKKVTRLRDKIIDAMRSYCEAYKLDTQEVDVSIDSAGEYRSMLARLTSDDLPRFEAKFKELLNENTIREVANFQSQLSRERETIRERITRINQSLTQIDYNPSRFIVLEAQPAADADVRDFQTELRACTEGALTGSDDQQYSESKFLQVKRIIERLRGREGQSELDRRWTRKVTDVRNWFVFSASERWREDGTEFEHYTDSGGKSRGQKEKLAYTVLAASLAYQFGLEWGALRSRTFRFVVIDEAFGRGSDESARFGLELFQRMNLQRLIVTPLQKIHVIEPYVASVGFVHNEDGRDSRLRNLTLPRLSAGTAQPCPVRCGLRFRRAGASPLAQRPRDSLLGRYRHARLRHPRSTAKPASARAVLSDEPRHPVRASRALVRGHETDGPRPHKIDRR